MHTLDELTRDWQGYDPLTETYHIHHEWGTAETLIETVVSAVAAITGKLPTEIETLYETIDPDALSALFEPISDAKPRNEGFVSFTLEGKAVMVHATGDIVIGVPDDAESETRPQRKPLANAVGALFDVQRTVIGQGWQTIGRTLSLQRSLLRWY